MSKFLISTAAALVLGGGALVSAIPAQAQVNIELGPRGPRIYNDRVERPVVERRTRRVVVEDDNDEECVVRTKRVRVDGVWRTRRTTVCE